MARERQTENGLQYYPRGLWPGFAVPGISWLILLFLVPFYAVLAVALGGRDPIFFSPTPTWNPLNWQYVNFQDVSSDIFGGFLGAVFIRTFTYVFIAVGACIVLGYPVAWFLARARGRTRTILLIAVLAPFWISYLMRMLAWQSILEPEGYVNRILQMLHVISEPFPWLEGKPITVVLGLVYGYVPFFILPLFAALDRIDKQVLEASRDLGSSPLRAFWRVVIPLSRQGLLAGTVIIMLPMFGDYYTTDFLSGRTSTTMIGNQITLFLTEGQTQQGKGAALVLTLSAMVAVLMAYYLISVARASREVIHR